MKRKEKEVKLVTTIQSGRKDGQGGETVQNF